MSNLTDISLNDQVRESTIRLLAVNGDLHQRAGGVIEKITGDLVAQVIIETFVRSGAPITVAMSACEVLNPDELAQQVRDFIWDMAALSGTTDENGIMSVDIDFGGNQ